MKKITISSFLLLGFFIVFSIPMSFAELYENQEYGFEINGPTGWYIDDYLITYEPFPGYDEGSANFVGFYDDMDSWNHSIDVSFIKNYFIAKNYQGQEYLDKLESELTEICQTATLEFDGYTCSNYKIMESKMIEIAGHDAYQIVASSTETYDDQSIFDVIGVSIDIPIDSNVWTVTSSSLEKEYPLAKNQIEKSIKSFKFTNDGIDPGLEYTNSENLPSYLQLITPHYVNSDIGLEINFPENWQGIQMKFTKELLENINAEAESTKQYSDELQQEQVMKILTDSTIVMAFPEDMMTAQDPEKLNMSMMFIIDVSAIANLSEMTEQVTTMSSSPDSLYGGSSSSADELNFDENCEFGSSKIIKVNNIKAYEIGLDCALPEMDQNMEMLMYMFGTEEHLIMLMHLNTSKPGQLSSTISEFNNTLDTLVMENPVDISDPQIYSEMFDMTIDTKTIQSNNMSHEVTLVSDVSISDFTFDEQSKTMEFKLLTEPKDNSQIGYTDIHLDDFLEGSSFYATIDGKELDVFVTEDTTSDKTILILEYPLPADKITITNQPGILQNTVSDSIPGWVKNTAGWWANGDVDDNSFVQSIQFLIEENIVIIPETEQSSNPSSISHEIPGWVKNTAGWWANGDVDDNSFVQSIQFLVENGIISLS